MEVFGSAVPASQGLSLARAAVATLTYAPQDLDLATYLNRLLSV